MRRKVELSNEVSVYYNPKEAGIVLDSASIVPLFALDSARAREREWSALDFVEYSLKIKKNLCGVRISEIKENKFEKIH